MPAFNLYLLSFVLLLSLIQSQYQPQTISYNDCSSIFCTQCLNQYQCAVCMYTDHPVCCPQFCTQCLDMNTCIACGFLAELAVVGNSVICVRAVYTKNIICANGQYLEPVTNACFTCNFPYCINCTSYMNCSQCKPGYYLFNTSQIGTNPWDTIIQIKPQCLPCMAQCTNCTDGASCISCASYYFYNGSVCAACAGQYCLTCSIEALNCTQCLGGAYLNGSQCILCSSITPQCSNCSFVSNQFTCNQCGFQYYWNDSQCLACGGNCLNCSLSNNNNVYCFQCISGYGRNPSAICEECPVGCIGCYPTAATNYAMSCFQCEAGYIYEFDQTTNVGSCDACQWPCVQCSTNSTVCLKCQIGFYLNLEEKDQNNHSLTIGRCYFCSIQNCVMCISAENCTACEQGYFVRYLTLSKQQICSPCPTNCALCFNQNITSNTLNILCLICAHGYTFLPNNNQTCVSCNNTNCALCLQNVANFCVVCSTGYRLAYHNDGISTMWTCVQCNLDNCVLCLPRIQNLPDGEQALIDSCAVCNKTFFAQMSTTQNFSYCLQCPENCSVCQNATYCNNCSYGFHLSTDNPQLCIACPICCLTCNSNGCLTCTDNYYAQNMTPVGSNTRQNVTCLPCSVIEGCFSCYNGAFCQECTAYMFAVLPGIDGSCLPCPDGCIQCDNEQQCLNCQEGYLLINEPNSCLQQSGWPIWAIFSACTLGFALIFVLGEKVRRKLLKKRKQQLLQMQLSELLTEN